MSEGEELPPSKLGTKSHWDMVYEREVGVFRDTGDEGEIWFGEGSLKKMRTWADKHLPFTSPNSQERTRIMECGAGNGTLLLSFLTSPESSGSQRYHLTGTDYSAGSITLAQEVEAAQRQALAEGDFGDDDDDEEDDERVVNDVTTDWREVDLLRHDFQGEQWDLVMDKGTFDALCLSEDKVDGRLPSQVYPEQIAKLVKDGGFFLITSCNFTEEEIKARWTKAGLGLTYHSSVPHKSFNFGGQTGTTVCTVAFKKTAMTNGVAVAQINGNGKPNGDSQHPLYICIDCGGTKTDVAISDRNGIVAKAIGGTGNMAEVGLQLSFEIIAATVLKAVEALPEPYRPAESTSNGHALTSPVKFADVWVGISGCDTKFDQDRMSALLCPFFGLPNVAVYNDAHLLGGALLTHHCPWGVAVIAGTGSVVICLEVDDAGEVVQIGRRGGTGYLLGDDGSAFDLGRCAIRYAFDDFDAGEEVRGGLADEIKEHFGVQETGEVLAKVYDLDPNLSPSDATNERKLRISSLSLPILRTFSQEPPDPLAVRAVHTAAGLLVDSIISLVRQMERTGKDVSKAALMLGGGVIRQESYRQVVENLLLEGGVEFGVIEVVNDVAGEGVGGLVERAKEASKK